VEDFAFLMPVGKPQQHQTLLQHKFAEARICTTDRKSNTLVILG